MNDTLSLILQYLAYQALISPCIFSIQGVHMDSVLLKEFNWISMLDDVGPTCWLTWDQCGGWCYSNMFQIILDQHVWFTGRALRTHYSTIDISMTSNQQHSKQNSNTVTVILIKLIIYKLPQNNLCWITLPTNGRAVLHLRSPKPGTIFSRKDTVFHQILQ